MRAFVPILVFAAVLVVTLNGDLGGQQPDAKKAQQKFDPPKTSKPDEATLKQIAEKTEQLRKAIEGLKAKNINLLVMIEIEVYLKAAENIVRFEEWSSKDSGKWALQTLDQGLERAKQAENLKESSPFGPWQDSRGKWIVRAYLSDLDNSIQPYVVLLPHNYGEDPSKQWRIDVVLHGRDASLTEAKFIASHGTTTKAAPKDLDHVLLEVYGRGNNAYRWAGENDVLESLRSFIAGELARRKSRIDRTSPVVLRGFSMGGAGTWHLGLHRPFEFAAIGPGAGFTATHGYVGNLPKVLPDYQEKCLRIYDAVDYAENAFNVPVVAYSGANDPQKAAADNIEKALKGFKEPLRFMHLVAPGLEHQMPKEWQDKAEAEYRKYLKNERETPEHVRFVTYTTRYDNFGHGWIEALERQYEKAVIDSHRTKDSITITTENIAELWLTMDKLDNIPDTINIDGQRVKAGNRSVHSIHVEKTDGKWEVSKSGEEKQRQKLRKRTAHTLAGEACLQGPIDDAFIAPFLVVPPSGEGWHSTSGKSIAASLQRFANEWDQYFRGQLPTAKAEAIDRTKLAKYNLILFGDPENNPLIAKVLPHLPITWTKDKLMVNGVEYKAESHYPVLIYPNPLNPTRYVVLNSGHTFHESDFKGTNALLYPRLGDWAVIKPTPTAKDPTAYEVVAAGLFDENWQFSKKK